MNDPRVEQMARLLVERSIAVKPGWQVIVRCSPLARPLVDEVVRLIGERGAYALVRMNFAALAGIPVTWAKAAPTDLLQTMPPLERHVAEHIDAYIIITAPENTRELAELDPNRTAILQEAIRPAESRRIKLEVPWVTCRFPTAALAQDAGMTLSDYEDFVFGACILDWDAEERRMRRYADRFDAAETVRIVGADTDITIGLSGRKAAVDSGHLNMPGGEFYFSPVEDSANGVVTYSEFPACYLGHFVEGVRFRFEDGRIVDASARNDEEFLFEMIDSDEGARRLGELGIGCNPRIQRHTKETLFDEKIDGTVHMAIGHGLPFIGGTNVSQVHWDMVKDLRGSGAIYCDGELVQENGKWLI